MLTVFSASQAYAAGFTYHIVQAASSAAGSKERNFDYYIPTSYVQGTPSPMYVVLHGCRISDRTMTDQLGMETYAERDRAIILYPFQNNDASSNDNDGRNPNCWGYWLDANIHRDAGEPGDIKRMIDYIKARFTVDSNHVHVTGISSGGAMTTIMQVAYPDVIASSAIIEGVGYSETAATYTGTSACSDVLNYNLGSVLPTSNVITNMRNEMKKSVLRQTPVLIMHNKQDCTVPFKVGQGIIDAFTGLLGADGKAVSTTPTSTSSGSVDGFPYTWSKYGRDASGNSLIETVVENVTASQVSAAGVQTLTTDPWDSSGTSDTAVKEDTQRGHWWPGAARRAPWILNKGLNANQVAADFFMAHPMSGAGSTTTTTTVGGTTTTTAATTTTSTKASTTTTVATTTTTTTVPYTQKVTDTVTNHYIAGRITVTQYNQLGTKYGYGTQITLYKCGTTWTNSSTCGPMV
jgi:poly(hydroxyalkanoate) depolymerase family esterase